MAPEQVSTITKLRIAVGILQDIKEFDDNLKFQLYVMDDEYGKGNPGSGSADGRICRRIADKADINKVNNYPESGKVDLMEYISLTLDEKVMQIERKGRTNRNYERTFCPEFKVSDDLKKQANDYVIKVVKKSGTSNTLIGEIFRALQYMEYRAFNDGDLPFIIGSPTFASYIFFKSQVDQLNFSSSAYQEDKGTYEFIFTDEYLKERSYEGRISDVIEDPLCRDAAFSRYQIVDLINSGQLKDDTTNAYDSREYSLIKKDSRW